MELKEEVLEYISKHAGCDSVDIVTHFKIRADISLKLVAELQQENKIERLWTPKLNYGYFMKLLATEDA